MSHPELTRRALAHKRSNGERLGRVPFGYQTAPDGIHLELDPDAQETLRRLHSLRADGLTLQAVADRLNAEGTAPPRAAKGGRQGSKWHLTTVHRLLNRPKPPRTINIPPDLWEHAEKLIEPMSNDPDLADDPELDLDNLQPSTVLCLALVLGLVSLERDHGSPSTPNRKAPK